jgi:hypothetical protein
MSSTPVRPPEFRRIWAALAVSGVLVLTLSLAVNPQRAWAGALLSTFYIVSLGLGGAVFLALTNVTGAAWHMAFRRIPEAMTQLLPVGGVALWVLLLTQASRFGWHHHGPGDAGTFAFKEFWLSPGFLLGRAAVCLVVWFLFSKHLVAASRRQDACSVTQDPQISAFPSVLFLFAFGITFSVATIDWIMALEPLWFSTIWAVYQFSGMIVGTLAMMIIAGILLRRHGIMAEAFRDDHLHDLAKLLLGFSCFWMYIWFCQYMLIWYSNIPEETSYFVRRTQGPWGPVVLACILLNWAIPFFVLLPRPCKRNERVMLRICVLLLLGRWVDLYIMIYPPVTGTPPVFGLPELATICTICGLTVMLFMRAFAAAEPVPQQDPWLSDSLHYHA